MVCEFGVGLVSEARAASAHERQRTRAGSPHCGARDPARVHARERCEKELARSSSCETARPPASEREHVQLACARHTLLPGRFKHVLEAIDVCLPGDRSS